MAAALGTPREIVDLLRKNKVVDEKRLDAYLQRVNIDRVGDDTAQWVNTLVQEGVLTNYQALQVLQGKKHFTIGKYKILERLGFGAMSNVYLCVDPATQQQVAVKVLTKLKAADSSAVERFFREARAAALLDHPNVVRAYGVDESDKDYFMAMDFVDGSSLADIVQHFGPLDITRCAHYIRQAAIGLQYAHEKGLVHRDIKPANLLVNRQGIVKILDMGLARFAQEEGQNLTQGEMLGSPEYNAPEQAEDSHNVDIRADIYGLGATFYFMLTGQAPYAEEKTLAQKIISKQTREPRPIASLRPEVPADLIAVVEKMMAKDPTKRYTTPHEVVQALTPWTQTPIAPPPEQEMPRLSPAARGEGLAAVSTSSEPARASDTDDTAPLTLRPGACQTVTAPEPQRHQAPATLRINPHQAVALKKKDTIEKMPDSRPGTMKKQPGSHPGDPPKPRAVETIQFDADSLVRSSSAKRSGPAKAKRQSNAELGAELRQRRQRLQLALLLALSIAAGVLAAMVFYGPK